MCLSYCIIIIEYAHWLWMIVASIWTCYFQCHENCLGMPNFMELPARLSAASTRACHHCLALAMLRERTWAACQCRRACRTCKTFPTCLDPSEKGELSIDYHGSPWITMDHHGPPWITMDHHGSPWITMGHHGSPWITWANIFHHKASKALQGIQDLPSYCHMTVTWRLGLIWDLIFYDLFMSLRQGLQGLQGLQGRDMDSSCPETCGAPSWSHAGPLRNWQAFRIFNR